MPTTLDDETNKKYQQALQAGIDPTKALTAAKTYQNQKNASSLGNQATIARNEATRLGNGTTSGALNYTLKDPESNANITKLAPLAIGAALTPFTGGLSLAGAAALTGAGTAAAEYGRQKLNNEQTDIGGIAKEGILSGAGTYVGGKLFNAAGGLIGKTIEGTAVGNAANKVGDFLNQDVGTATKSAANALNKVIGRVPSTAGSSTGKLVDISSSLSSLNPEDATALLKSGHLPSSLSTGDAKAPIDTTKKVVWNPSAKRIEVIPTNEPTGLPNNPGEVNFNQNPTLENPSSPQVSTPVQPRTLENPATGEATPVSQPASTGEIPASKPNLLTRTGDSMRQSVVNPQVKASPFGASEEGRLTDVATKQLGLKGSPSEQYTQLGNKFDEIQNQVTEALKGSSATVNKEDLITSLKSNLDNTFSEVDDKALQTLEKNLDKITSKSGDIKVQDLYEYKKTLSTTLKRAFAKLDSPTAVLTPKEETALAGWKQISQAIGEAEPSVAAANGLQRDIFDLAPGLAKSRVGTSTIKIPGTQIGLSKNASGAMKDATGRLLQGAGSILPSASQGAGKTAATGLNLLAGSRSGTEAAQIGQTGQLPLNPEDAFTPPKTEAGVDDLANDVNKASTNPFADPGFIQFLIVTDAQKTGGKNLGIIQSLATLAQGNASTKPATSDQTKAYGFATRINNAEKILGSDIGNSASGILFGLENHLPNVIKPENNQRYDQASRDFINAVLRRESGAAISPSEFENAQIQYLPHPGDTQGTLAQKAQNRAAVLQSLQLEAKGATTGDLSNLLPSNPSQVSF